MKPKLLILLINPLLLIGCGANIPKESIEPEDGKKDPDDYVPQDPEYDNLFKYKLRYGDVYSISPKDKTKLVGDIIIPGVFNGKKVTIIEGYSFMNCDNVTSVELSNNLTKIQDNAFFGTNVGSDFVIPDNVIEIGISSFNSCGIRNLTIGNSIEDLPFDCFGSNPIEEATIGDNIKSICNPFNNCTDLKTVYIGKSLETIHPHNSGTFFMCENLENIFLSPENKHFVIENKGLFSIDKKTIYSLPAKVVSDNYILPDETEMIEWYAFNDTSITQITFGKHLNTVGYGAFSHSRLLKRVICNDELRYVDQTAFANGEFLEEIIFPDSVETIESACFFSSGIESKLTKVVLPKTIKIIPVQMFCGCNKLVDLFIPKSVEVIKERAFFDSVSEFYYEGTIEQWFKIEKRNEWSNKLETLLVHCFDGDTNKYS